MQSLNFSDFFEAVLVIAALCLSVVAQDESKRKQVIKGTVVAESNDLLACGWHICGLRIVVRLDKPISSGKYAIVRITYIEDRSKREFGKPLALVERASRWKFTAVPDGAEPLSRYLKVVDAKGADIVRNSKLPLGGFSRALRRSVCRLAR